MRFKYNQAFFEGIQAGSFRSAMRIVPLVKELVPIKSVIDMGCGSGAWLKAFQINGSKTILGVDGNTTLVLEIPRNRFLRADLDKRFEFKERFDLAVSLEVAEHLSPKSADLFVENLIRLAPAVLFSAAIPGQGGTFHRNEQWPVYWAEKFARHGYSPYDCLRQRIWEDPEVEWWYSQNILLYVKKGYGGQSSKLRRLAPSEPPAKLIHPRSLSILTLLRRVKDKFLHRIGF